MVLRFCIFFFLLAGVAWPVLSQEVLFDENEENGDTYALVVGISQYQNEGITPLQFANRDAEMFALFLTTEGGGQVPPGNIVLLVDSLATSGAVLTELRALTKKCQQGDRAIIYFSGHGDVDRDLFEEGYLLTFDTPPNNYYGNAVGVDYLQDLINALYAKKGIEVLLVTDACRAGTLAGNTFNGRALTSQAILDQIPEPTKILSCLSNQESIESPDLGGGRGVFSYFLIRGLAGEADTAPKDGVVTVGEIQIYLLTNIPGTVAPHQQIPQVESHNMSQELSRVLEENQELLALNETPSSEVQARSAQLMQAKAPLPEDADLSTRELAGQFQVALQRRDLMGGTRSAHTLYLKLLQKLTPAELEPFKKELAIALQEEAQGAINRYLAADSTEMAKRMFIAQTYVFEQYPLYLSTAAGLFGGSDLLYEPLIAKSRYFEAVNIRLKGLIEGNAEKAALQASRLLIRALETLTHAAYIHQELALNYETLSKWEEAEKHYRTAAELAPTWALPLSSLAGLYRKMGREEQSIQFGRMAVEKAPELFEGYIQTGKTQEASGNWLAAETSYREGLDRNMDSYIPFERLGYLYLKMGAFELADEMLYEAELRKGLQVVEPDIFEVASPSFFLDRDGPLSVVTPIYIPLQREDFYLTLLFLNPQDIQTYLLLARHYWGLKDFEQAERMYRQVLALHAEEFEATDKLLSLYQSQDRKAAWETLLNHAQAYFVWEVVIDQQLTLYTRWQRPLMREGIYTRWGMEASLDTLFEQHKRYLPMQWRAYRQNTRIEGYLRYFADSNPLHAVDQWYHLGALRLVDDAFIDSLLVTPAGLFSYSPMTGEAYQQLFLNQYPDYPAKTHILNLLGRYFTAKAEKIRTYQENYRTERQYEKWKLNFHWQAFQRDPDNLDLQFAYIQSLLDNWQYEEVLKRLEELDQGDLLDRAWKIKLAKLKLFAGQEDEAQHLLQEAAEYFVSQEETTGDWHEAQGLWFQKQGETDLARGHFEVSIARNPQDKNGYYQYCRMLAKQGELERALEVLEGALINDFRYDFVFKYDPALAVLREWHKFDEQVKAYGIQVGQYRRATRYR